MKLPSGRTEWLKSLGLQLSLEMIFFSENVDRRVGFRRGEKGTHSSRTMMLEEITAVLNAVPIEGGRADYVDSVIEGNSLRKPTTSTRRLSLQRLTELYALDPDVPIFRVMRRMWSGDFLSQPLVALLVALARDPLLAETAQVVIPLAAGQELPRKSMVQQLQRTIGERMSEATLDKVVRNAASSWTQSGHLSGRTFKVRRRVQPTARAVALGLYLAVGAGFHGEGLLTSGWIRVLDCTPSRALDLAMEAKRLGLLDLRVAGNVFDLNLDRLDHRTSGSTA